MSALRVARTSCRPRSPCLRGLGSTLGQRNYLPSCVTKGFPHQLTLTFSYLPCSLPFLFFFFLLSFFFMYVYTLTITNNWILPWTISVHAASTHYMYITHLLVLWSGVRFPEGERDFLIHKTSIRTLGPCILIFNSNRAFSPGVKVTRAWSWSLSHL